MASSDSDETVALRKPGSEPSVATSDELPGRGERIGRYVVGEVLGRGGMGVVYAAEDPELRRRVALKLMRPEVVAPGSTEQVRERLLREAQAMAQLSHPNVVQVHDVGTFDGQVFLAMELVDGHTLTDWLDESPRPWRQILEVFIAAGRGLQAAHAVGLIHRDFKPHNVLIGAEGRVRVGDFGLARAPRDNSVDPDDATTRERSPDLERSDDLLATPLTQTGLVIGTPKYMSPEQAEGEAVDERSDQFSFCVALWEALLGVAPFEGSNREELLASIRRDTPTRPDHDVEVPRRVVEAVARGLRCARDDRFARLDELLDQLDASLQRRRPVILMALGAAVLGAAAAALLVWSGASKTEPCRAAGLGEAWSGERQAAVEAALTAENVSYGADTWQRVQRHVNATNRELIRMSKASCKALREREQDEIHGLRVACLARKRAQLRAVLELLAAPGNGLTARAIDLVNVDVAACEGASLPTFRIPAPADPKVQIEIQQLEDELERVHPLVVAGRLDDAKPIAQRVATRAAALTWKPLQAEAEVQLGAIEMHALRWKPAAQLLEAAARTAELAGHDAARANAYLHLVSVFVGQAKYEEALRWAGQARALLERTDKRRATDRLGIVLTRIYRARGDVKKALQQASLTVEARKALGDQPVLLGEAYSQLAQTQLYAAGKPELAYASFAKARDIYSESLGDAHPRVAAQIELMGFARLMANRVPEALKHYRDALARTRAALGDDNPATVSIWSSIGIALSRLGKTKEAIPAFQKAIDGTEATAGRDAAQLASLYAVLGGALKRAGRTAEALAAMQRAQQVAIKHHGANHPDAITTTNGVATMHFHMGNYERALAELDKSAAAAEAVIKGRPLHGTTLTHLGRALTAAGKRKQAIPALERALTIDVPTDPTHKAWTREWLAKALWGQGKRKRAIAEARRAAAIYDNAGAKPAAAAVRAWMAKPTAR